MRGVASSAPSQAQRFLRRASRRSNLWFGSAILIVFALIAAFGPWIAPYDASQQNLLATLAGPSSEHWLGTDHIGRDVLSRTLVGTRYSLLVCIVSVTFGAALGIPIGVVSGFFRGRVDAVLSSAVDIVLTIPTIVLAIAIVAIVGPGLTGLVVAISLSYAPRVARIARSAVLEVREEEYVTSAAALGAGRVRVLGLHVLPNISAPLTVELTLLAGQAVLVATALGFLGLGVQPPLPEWGTMLSRGKDYLSIAPHIVAVPGIAIALLVLGFNYLGDGLRDLWDPKLDA